MQFTLDELKPMVSSIEDLKTSLTQGIDEIDHALGDRFQSLELAAWHFNDLKLKVEASVEDLHVEDAARHKTMNRVVLDSSTTSAPGIFTKPGSTTVFLLEISPPDDKPPG